MRFRGLHSALERNLILGIKPKQVVEFYPKTKKNLIYKNSKIHNICLNSIPFDFKIAIVKYSYAAIAFFVLALFQSFLHIFIVFNQLSHFDKF